MNIKSYIQFLNESFEKDTAVMHEYSIYQWFENLKRDNWKSTNIEKHKIWTEHFIGEGWWNKITSHVDKIFDCFKKVDIDYINDRMLDVWDEFLQKEKSNYLCVLYGNYKDKDKVNEIKFNGQRPIMELSEDRKNSLIIGILIDIVYPTLFIGYPSTELRQTKQEQYVTDEKWQCQNFNIDNYSIKSGMEFQNPNERRPTKIFDHTLNEIRGYSPEVVLNLYQPGLVLNIGGWSDSHLTGKFSLRKIEDLMDDVLPSILSSLNYSSVLWDNAREGRKFSDDTEVYDYDVKILLKM